MTDDRLSEEEARLKKAREFFAAEKKLQKEEEILAQKSREEKGDVHRRDGESTGEWLARRDAEVP